MKIFVANSLLISIFFVRLLELLSFRPLNPEFLDRIFKSVGTILALEPLLSLNLPNPRECRIKEIVELQEGKDRFLLEKCELDLAC